MSDYIDTILRDEERRQAIAERNAPKCDACGEPILGEVIDYSGTWCRECVLSRWRSYRKQILDSAPSGGLDNMMFDALTYALDEFPIESMILDNERFE